MLLDRLPSQRGNEAEQSQRPSTEIIADEALPSTASQRCILVHEMTRTGQWSSLSALLDPSYHPCSCRGPNVYRHRNGFQCSLKSVPVPTGPAGRLRPSSRCSTPDDMCRAVYFLARPVSGMRTYSRYADNDSAKMCARGHVLTRLIEVEYLIEYWLNAARRYRTAHRLEHLHRAASAPHLAGRFTRRPPALTT